MALGPDDTLDRSPAGGPIPTGADLFTGPEQLISLPMRDRLARKPEGTSDQGRRED